jgi:hypothetical protein
LEPLSGQRMMGGFDDVYKLRWFGKMLEELDAEKHRR